MNNTPLLEKYARPVARYTSYPTVPFWQSQPDTSQWERIVRERFRQAKPDEGISLYIHLPFCESLCTYCACNKKITTNHKMEDPYIKALIREWRLYLNMMEERPVIRTVHLGGGTPTFFSAENLQLLLSTIFQYADIHADPAFSLEGHPNNTTEEHLETLYALGFRRLSLGVQDNDPIVQRAINRIQPLEKVKRVTELARSIGYGSVNFDLIYGLPFQTMTSMEKTMNETIDQKPDRIAYYAYSHVPWKSRGQRLFNEADLPGKDLRQQLYRLGKFHFRSAGYHEVGMDHFALPGDELFVAKEEGRLHRDFMGYTSRSASMIIALGMSGISDLGNAYAQNHKTLHAYYDAINNGRLAVTNGYFLDETDQAMKKYILDISCNGGTSFRKSDLPLLRTHTFAQLEELASDGLINWDESGLKVSTKGHYFIRNICEAFDLYAS